VKESGGSERRKAAVLQDLDTKYLYRSHMLAGDLGSRRNSI
jgi:hypothetical protein